MLEFFVCFFLMPLFSFFLEEYCHFKFEVFFFSILSQCMIIWFYFSLKKTEVWGFVVIVLFSSVAKH